MRSDECVWPACEERRSTILDLAVCDRHALNVYRTVAVAIRDSEVKPPVEKPKRSAQRNRRTTMGLVYFMRFGRLIKIGYTTNLQSRIKSLGPDEVLATIPGTMIDEERIQHQFGACWLGREMFEPSSDLMEYIESIRESHPPRIPA